MKDIELKGVVGLPRRVTCCFSTLTLLVAILAPQTVVIAQSTAPETATDAVVALSSGPLRRIEIVEQLKHSGADAAISVELSWISRIYDTVGEHVYPVTNDDLEEVAELGEWVTAIRLHHTAIGDEGVSHLKPLRRLKHLSISRDRRGVEAGHWEFAGMEITDRSLETIATFEKLEWLSLTGSPKITDKGLSDYARAASQLKTHNGLTIVQHLKSLDLSGTNIDGSCLEALAQLPVERLVLTDMPHFDVGNLSHLKKMTHLKELDLSQNVSLGHEQWSEFDFDTLEAELPGVMVKRR